MSNPPTVSEELARKSIEELERLMTLQAAGRLQAGEFALCAKSIWAIASGLVDADTMGAMQQAADAFGTPSRSVHFLSSKSGAVYTFTWHPEADDYRFIKRGVPHPEPSTTVVSVDRDARGAALTKLFTHLSKAGWTLL